jgi:hypothetical protein
LSFDFGNQAQVITVVARWRLKIGYKIVVSINLSLDIIEPANKLKSPGLGAVRMPFAARVTKYPGET